MRHKKNKIIIPLLALSLLVVASFVFSENDESLEALRKKTSEGLKLIDAPEREIFLPKKDILKILKIEPDMTIVDIGAGIGFFTFPIADVLQNTGTVYATDIMQANLDYIKAKAEKLGYKNIVTVRVSPIGQKGPDLFYREHTFDIIFTSEMLAFIWDIEDYFQGLRPSLKKETGRLYILELSEASYFHDADFGNFKQLCHALSAANLALPFIEKLSPTLKNFLAAWHDEEVPPEIREQVLLDLNAILDDRLFPTSLIEYWQSDAFPNYKNEPWPRAFDENLGLNNENYVKSIVELNTLGVFDKNDKVLTEKEFARVKRLNKALIVSMLHLDIPFYRLSQGFAMYSKENIIARMKDTGYTLVADHNFLPKHHFLEFKRSD